LRLDELRPGFPEMPPSNGSTIPRKTPMPLTIRKLHPLFAGEVTGADLTRPLDRDEAQAIEVAMDEYAVLVFPKQDITDEQQLAFARNFGEREDGRGGTVAKAEDARLTPRPR
jgi:alpha-ketoglutarate-dependent 2,4-dichlorophenoxyacetate dioxygenase